MSYFCDNIDKLKGYEPGFQPKQLDVVKLNTNENPFEPSPKVIERLRNITTEQLRRYPDPIGNQFREAAGELNGVSAEHIMCCNGGDDLLNLAFRAFCDENRPAAYPVPTYSLYPVLAKIQNCPVIEIPFDREFNLPSKLVATNAPLTIVCNPNAPSGTFISVDEIASLADEISGVLLIDEAYCDYAEKNCAALVKDFDNVIILRSLSKGYSLAGLRFGYAIAQPELINGLMKVKDSYNVDAISIALATEAIKDQEYFKANIEKIKTERTRLTDELRNLGLKVPNSFSNFVFAESKDSSAARIFEELKKRNIFVRYFPYPGLENKLRISVGKPEQDDKLIDALKEILAA
ncbi:MAG: histidinol-phosphate transaminase [Sedimentisphaerales bacterium]|nr:histidinol-phosphate transaminase [Sedimentisphaerales bacterium]